MSLLKHFKVGDQLSISDSDSKITHTDKGEFIVFSSGKKWPSGTTKLKTKQDTKEVKHFLVLQKQWLCNSRSRWQKKAIVNRSAEDFTPDPINLLESNRSLGYSIEEAVSDLIDNSVAAGQKTFLLTLSGMMVARTSH